MKGSLWESKSNFTEWCPLNQNLSKLEDVQRFRWDVPEAQNMNIAPCMGPIWVPAAVHACMNNLTLKCLLWTSSSDVEKFNLSQIFFSLVQRGFWRSRTQRCCNLITQCIIDISRGPIVANSTLNIFISGGLIPTMNSEDAAISKTPAEAKQWRSTGEESSQT